jgi:hypothetical protein
MARDEEIKLEGIIVEEVTEPRNDGTPGSGLYAVPFRLSGTPDAIWAELFVNSWNLPPRFTSMHRPGIARVEGDRIVLDGTTIEEVKRYHFDTLKLAVSEANRLVGEQKRTNSQQTSASQSRKQRHRDHVAEIAKSLKFEH